MSGQKSPVLVCVPGVMQGDWLYEPLKAEIAPLEVVALTLPGTVPLDDPRPALDSMYPDVELISKTISDLLDAGRDVIVLVHSYGGTPGGDAVGRIVAEQKQNTPAPGSGRILWMIYSSAYPTIEGVSCWDSGDRLFEAAGIPKPASPGAMPGMEEKDGYLVPDSEAGPAFMHDVPDLETWVKKLGKQSVACPLSPILAPAVGYRVVPTTYIKTLQDTVIPPDFQEGLVQQALQLSKERQGLVPFTDEEVGRLEIDSGHAPMLSKTTEYKDLIMKVVRRAMSA